MTLATSPHITPAEACQNATSFEDAADNLLDLWVEQGYCFTSGHLTHTVRHFRTDLRFSHASMGTHLRDRFDNNTLPSFDDGMGGALYPVQVERTTSGQSRTPVGTMVYCYGPDQNEADLFEFELDINDPTGVVNDGSFAPTTGLSPVGAALQATKLTSAKQISSTPVPATQPHGQVSVAKGRNVPGDALAKVHRDGRLCIPRLAFEALAFVTGVPIVGGEPLYIAIDLATQKIKIRQGSAVGFVEVCPTTDKLRVHLTIPSAIPALDVGNAYPVELAGEVLTIDLNYLFKPALRRPDA